MKRREAAGRQGAKRPGGKKRKLPAAAYYVLCLVLLSGALLLYAGKTLKGPSAVPEYKDAPEAVPAETAGLSVRIIPASPTSVDSLTALVYGARDSMTFQWAVNGEAVEGVNGATLQSGGYGRGDEVRVYVTADGSEVSESVVIGNVLPVVKGVTLNPVVIHRGIDITAAPVGADIDGDVVNYRYQWIINGEEQAVETDLALKGDRFKRGDKVTVRLVPYDTKGEGAGFTPPPITIPDAPPMFTSVPPESFSSRTYVYMVSVEDADGDHVSLSLAKAPKGMGIDEKGRISWEITDKDAGVHPVEIVADDGYGSRTVQSYEINIQKPE